MRYGTCLYLPIEMMTNMTVTNRKRAFLLNLPAPFEYALVEE